MNGDDIAKHIERIPPLEQWHLNIKNLCQVILIQFINYFLLRSAYARRDLVLSFGL